MQRIQTVSVVQIDCDSMAAALPDFPAFDINAEPTSLSQRWQKWTSRFENLITALDIKDPARKKALLLHYAGQDVHEIYDTLPIPTAEPEPASTTEQTSSTPPVTQDAYQKAKTALDEYFMPKKNVDYETYVFRQAWQKPGETLDMFQSRLRQLAATCDFTDVDHEIKAQIVLGCVSTRL